MQQLTPSDTQAHGCLMGAGLRIKSQLEADGRMLLIADGLLKYDAASPLQHYFAEQMEALGASSAIIDCGRLTFVDSHGLALLLLLHRQCQTRGGKLALRQLNNDLRRLLELTRIDILLSVE